MVELDSLAFRAELCDDGAQAQLTLVGEIDLATAGEVVRALASVDGQRVLVDMSGVTFCDSSGVAALIRAGRDRDSVVITNAPENVRQVFRILGVDDMLGGRR